MPEHISIRIAGKFVQAQKILDLSLKNYNYSSGRQITTNYLSVNLTNRRQSIRLLSPQSSSAMQSFSYTFLRSLVYFTSFSSPQITFVHAPLSCLFCTLFEFQLLTVDGRRQSLYFGCGLHFTYLCTLRRLTTKQLWSFKT